MEDEESQSNLVINTANYSPFRAKSSVTAFPPQKVRNRSDESGNSDFNLSRQLEAEPPVLNKKNSRSPVWKEPKVKPIVERREKSPVPPA